MKKFEVLIDRTSVRTVSVKIVAENEEDAIEKALDQAGDIDFTDAETNGVEYDAFISGEE